MCRALCVAFGGMLFLVQGPWGAATLAAPSANDHKAKAAVRPAPEDSPEPSPRPVWHTDYAKAVKLQRAQVLIQEGKRANEAGYLVGYNSPSQFCREYKRHFGFAPSATR